jgi:hypothetical protein
MCVPVGSVAVACNLLCSNGLFEESPLAPDDFNNYTEYMRGFPRMQTTSWAAPVMTLVIFPADFFELDPLEKSLVVAPSSHVESHLSKEVASELTRGDFAHLPLPRLPPLLRGLVQLHISTRDDPAIIAIEQMVDGMNLGEAWVDRNLRSRCTDDVNELITRQTKDRLSRIDYYSDNKVTCHIV